jgi:TPR repeat protein
MTDEKDRGINSLIPSAAGEIAVGSTSLVRRGLNLLNRQKLTEDATVAQLREAAEQGDADAQNRLGVRYSQGDGVSKDDSQAVVWHRKAAENGHWIAQINLSRHYADGRGVPQDYAQSARWVRKAAEQGESVALWLLGDAYATGEGVLQDYVEAHKWMNLAVARASAGLADDRLVRHWHKKLAGRRDAVAKKMTPEQIAEAQKRASEWLAAFEKRAKL